jgi:histidine ammonia-lyase
VYITNSGNKEDFVSMGMTSALKYKDVVRNTRAVLAIEALSASRALDLLKPLRSSLPIERMRERIRAVSAPFIGDRVLHHDISALEKLLAAGGFRL